jgi:hypothetical protein
MDITPVLEEAYNRGVDAAITVIKSLYPPEIAEPIIENLKKLKL